MALLTCSECGGQVSSTASACPHCGAPVSAALAVEERKCAECGAVLPEGAAACPTCGCPVEEKPAQPIQQAPPAPPVRPPQATEPVKPVQPQYQQPVSSNGIGTVVKQKSGKGALKFFVYILLLIAFGVVLKVLLIPKTGGTQTAGEITQVENQPYEVGVINGIMLYNCTGTYSGGWQDGKPAGTGTFFFEGSQNPYKYKSYTGSWENGRMHGYGTMEFMDERGVLGKCSTYVGEWNKGRIYGKGKMTYADGSVYDGDWVCEKHEGHGKFILEDGSVYQDGEWKENKFLG